MLDAFRMKAFYLQPIYEKWQDGPYFNGNPKDISVEEWLDKIKEGCIKYGVPEGYWYKVAQHFMGPAAIKRPVELLFQTSGNLTAPHRLEELKQIHGKKYRWTWKKFRIAILDMGCMFCSTLGITSESLTQPLQDIQEPEQVPLPSGVFTPLTDCYSPTCSRDQLCYSIACPRRLEQQARLNMKPQPGLSKQISKESLIDLPVRSFPFMSNRV